MGACKESWMTVLFVWLFLLFLSFDVPDCRFKMGPAGNQGEGSKLKDAPHPFSSAKLNVLK